MTGFNTIAMVSVAVAAVGSVAGYALVRSRDFVGAAARLRLRRSRARASEAPTEYASIILDSTTGNQS